MKTVILHLIVQFLYLNTVRFTWKT